MVEKLTDKQKKIINDIVFYIIILAIILLSINAYNIYKEYGFNHCLEEKNDVTGKKEIHCFNTSKEMNIWIERWKDDNSVANNLDNNYISDYDNISFIK